MLHSQGVRLEDLGIAPVDGTSVGEVDPRKAWRVFAGWYHLFRSTPSRIWLDWVSAEVFGLEVRLSAETADHYYGRIAELLPTDEFRPRALFKRFNIELLSTTESPLDMLEEHQTIYRSGWDGRIISAYRPDSVIDPEFDSFRKNLSRLSELTGEDAFSWSGYLAAHRTRRAAWEGRGHPSRSRRGQGSGRRDATFTSLVTEELDGSYPSPACLCSQAAARGYWSGNIRQN